MPEYCLRPPRCRDVQEAKSGRIDVFLTTNDKKKNPPPIYPTAGTHVLPLKKVFASICALEVVRHYSLQFYFATRPTATGSLAHSLMASHPCHTSDADLQHAAQPAATHPTALFRHAPQPLAVRTHSLLPHTPRCCGSMP
jgi:hypothetical protein